MLKLGALALGGDQFQLVISTDDAEPVSNIKLRIEFGSGDEMPWAVISGITGYDAEGELEVDSEYLTLDNPIDVLIVVPQQNPRAWHLSWLAADGQEQENSGTIE